MTDQPDDETDDESREKYGIAGGKSTVEKLQGATDDGDNENENENENEDGDDE